MIYFGPGSDLSKRSGSEAEKIFPDPIRAARKVPNTLDNGFSYTEILSFEEIRVSWDSIKVIGIGAPTFDSRPEPGKPAVLRELLISSFSHLSLLIIKK
jgi:hypothetical protein